MGSSGCRAEPRPAADGLQRLLLPRIIVALFFPRVRLSLVFLVARSEGSFGSKIDQKTRPENQNQVAGTATSFLARETVGFCLVIAQPPAWCNPLDKKGGGV